MSLKIYCVTHHEYQKEYTTSIVASSKLEASELAGGEVMDVSSGIEVYRGMKISSSGYSFRMIKPKYKNQSDNWINYLKKVNLIGEAEG